MKIFLFFLFLPVAFLLSGCADMTNTMFYPLGYQPIEKATAKACERSSVLITDLQIPLKQRRYLLPDGRVCLLEATENNSEA